MSQLKINFNLDKPKSKSQTYIFHSITYKGKRYRIYSGFTVLPKNWNFQKREIRASESGYSDINQILFKQKGDIETIVNKAILNKIEITKKHIVEQLEFTSKRKTSFDFLDLYDEFIEVSKATKSPSTVSVIETTKKHLTNY